MRKYLITVMAPMLLVASPGYGANKEVTGDCVCKRGGSVLYTASATICVNPDHGGCTAAKLQCVQQQAVPCTQQGGTIQQSTQRCTYGDKC